MGKNFVILASKKFWFWENRPYKRKYVNPFMQDGVKIRILSPDEFGR